MLNTRLIARLDVKGPNLIKGVHLEGLRVMGDPNEFAIKYYKDTFQWQNGFESWSKVPTTEDYHMLAPNLGLEAKGAKEIEEVIFGFVNETELKQELVDIIEHGNYITCLLKITTKTGETMDVVEVFLVDDNGKVKNIWAL